MQATAWQRRAARVAIMPAVFGLGCAAAIVSKDRAGSQNVTPPVQPSAQVLGVQSAFEQVADKLRPSVVFIESRQTVNGGPVMRFRQGAMQGQDFPFSIPGFPGQGNGRFRAMPQDPQFPQHATASGSGVIVRSDGYILTNDHVVAGADRVTVHLQDGRELTGQVKRDYRSDLAVVKIDANNLPAAELGNSDTVKTGQWAIAFGSPFGLSDTMTVGVISALHRSQQIGESAQDQRYYSSLIQTDASINPGNSGGALVDVYGRVIGINVAIESPSGGNVGIGFAIPSNTARYVMDQLITKGTVTRGYLGVKPITPTYKQKQAYGVKSGALVQQVSENTPAAAAGLQVEDIILKYDGRDVQNEYELRDMVARTAPDTKVSLLVKRNGSEQTVRVTIAAAPAVDTVTTRTQAPVETVPKGKLGVQVGDASDPQIRESLGTKAGEKGAVVTEVVEGSPAQEAGIRAGDVIVRLAGKAIDNAAALSAVSHSLPKSGSVTAVIKRQGGTMLVEITLE